MKSDSAGSRVRQGIRDLQRVVALVGMSWGYPQHGSQTLVLGKISAKRTKGFPVLSENGDPSLKRGFTSTSKDGEVVEPKTRKCEELPVQSRGRGNITINKFDQTVSRNSETANTAFKEACSSTSGSPSVKVAAPGHSAVKRIRVQKHNRNRGAPKGSAS